LLFSQVTALPEVARIHSANFSVCPIQQGNRTEVH
jgi:hypothetical protein